MLSLKVCMLRFSLLVTMLALFSLHHVSTLYTKSACIIIHGTWAKDESWYKPQGDFFKSIQSCNLELGFIDEIVCFSWSGKLGYPAQVEAAQELAKKIQQYDFVILIGHSHGVTVGILASKILAQNISNQARFFKIAKFYSLGCPVDMTGQIYPDMSVVGKFYNLFSFGDYVQPINLSCDRCFPYHERVVNISVMLQKEYPNHSQLHHAAIAKNILKIEEYFANKKLQNFENFSFNFPGMISFFDHDLPLYEIQHDQKKLLDLDKKVHWLATMAFFRTLKKDKDNHS